MTTRTSTASRDGLGWDKYPFSSNSVKTASPPLVVVGGIASVSYGSDAQEKMSKT